MMYWIFCIFSFLIILAALIIWAERRGRILEQAEDMQGVLDDIHVVSLARDRLRHDPDYAGRVRRRFTRTFL